VRDLRRQQADSRAGRDAQRGGVAGDTCSPGTGAHLVPALHVQLDLGHAEHQSGVPQASPLEHPLGQLPGLRVVREEPLVGLDHHPGQQRHRDARGRSVGERTQRHPPQPVGRGHHRLLERLEVPGSVPVRVVGLQDGVDQLDEDVVDGRGPHRRAGMRFLLGLLVRRPLQGGSKVGRPTAAQTDPELLGQTADEGGPTHVPAGLREDPLDHGLVLERGEQGQQVAHGLVQRGASTPRSRGTAAQGVEHGVSQLVRHDVVGQARPHRRRADR
jgi:hypothetical protein